MRLRAILDRKSLRTPRKRPFAESNASLLSTCRMNNCLSSAPAASYNARIKDECSLPNPFKEQQNGKECQARHEERNPRQHR